MTTAAPRLTIVIVTYNSTRDIDRVLRSLTDPPPATTHEIVVVDNASTDDTVTRIRLRDRSDDTQPLDDDTWICAAS